METYSRTYLFMIYMTGLIFGRGCFVLSLIMWILAIINGTRTIVPDAVTPDPVLTELAIIFGVLWALGISVYVMMSLFLPCDKCGHLNFWHKFTHHKTYASSERRNKIIRFFVPDEIVDKKYMCPHCNTIFGLKLPAKQKR